MGIWSEEDEIALGSCPGCQLEGRKKTKANLTCEHVKDARCLKHRCRCDQLLEKILANTSSQEVVQKIDVPEDDDPAIVEGFLDFSALISEGPMACAARVTTSSSPQNMCNHDNDNHDNNYDSRAIPHGDKHHDARHD